MRTGKNNWKLKLREFVSRSHLFYWMSSPLYFLHDLIRYRPDLSDKEQLRRTFKMAFGKDLDLENPQTFNEKIQWLKLYDRSPLHEVCADKYLMRKYVQGRVGDKYVIPIIFWTKDPSEIKRERFPDAPVVVKTNHDQGTVFVIHDRDTFDFRRIRIRLKMALKRNLYWPYREWQYQNIDKKIMVEQFLGEKGAEVPVDFKMLCMNGRVEVIQVHHSRFGEGLQNWYTRSWTEIEVTRPGHSRGAVERRPEFLDEMIDVAERLAEPFIFVRVDLYTVLNRVYVGELSFHPAAGLKPFCPDSFDLQLGRKLELPEPEVVK